MKALLVLGLAAMGEARLGTQRGYKEYSSAMAAVPGSAASEAPASEASEGDRRAVASAFVETRRIGEGRPTPPEHDSALGYHSTRKEAHPAKAGTLPPPTRFAATSAKLVPSPGSTNPYSLGSVYGRGAQDGMTPFQGSYSGAYGPLPGTFGTAGYGSFPGTIDPRGFGGTWNHSAPYGTFFGPMMGNGIPKEGFKYQVPWSPLHPGAPYTGQPFSSFGAQGPYWSPWGAAERPGASIPA